MIRGIVDLGSNTIRLSIYQCGPEGSHLLMNRKVMAGLADYVERGAMTPQGIQVACQVLRDYRALMDNLQFQDLHVFATASLRNIVNTEEAVAQIQAETGLTVDVVSGAEEARLSFLGAVDAGPDSGLLVDLGGGSTELVEYEARTIRTSCSLLPVPVQRPCGRPASPARGAQSHSHLCPAGTGAEISSAHPHSSRLRRRGHCPGGLQNGKSVFRPAGGLQLSFRQRAAPAAQAAEGAQP